jgi:Xaa-Pro aminopeptidase
MDRYCGRRDRLRGLLRRKGIGALLVTHFTNVTYLTGFTGDDSYLLLRADGETILSDARYTTQLGEECPGVDLHIRPPGMSMSKAVEKVVKATKLDRLAIEGDSMTVGLRDQMASRLPETELVATAGLVELLRQVKDKHEIAAIRLAIWHAEKGFGVLRATLDPRKTEKQVADELEHEMRKFGARAAAFPTIAAAGPRAALPHAKATAAPIGDSDFLLVDWGANEGLYLSDLTRVLVTGRLSPKFRRIYAIVLDAQLAAIAAIRPGIAAQDVDAVARNKIKDAGFGRYFGHGLGHGLGLEVHEGPRLNSSSKTVLKAGMVITVEPGIYLPGWGGIRIEDDVLVTRTGCEVLTGLPKAYEEAVVR